MRWASSRVGLTIKSDGKRPSSWEERNLVAFKPPFPMAPSRDQNQSVTRIRCHGLATDSLKRVLVSLAVTFKSEQVRRHASISLHGGAYEFRRISGGHRLSVQTWGAAIDFDPERARDVREL